MTRETKTGSLSLKWTNYATWTSATSRMICRKSPPLTQKTISAITFSQKIEKFWIRGTRTRRQTCPTYSNNHKANQMMSPTYLIYSRMAKTQSLFRAIQSTLIMCKTSWKRITSVRKFKLLTSPTMKTIFRSKLSNRSKNTLRLSWNKRRRETKSLLKRKKPQKEITLAKRQRQHLIRSQRIMMKPRRRISKDRGKLPLLNNLRFLIWGRLLSPKK